MCICHIPYGYLSIDLCVIDMSAPVQAGRYPSLGLLRLHHLHVVEVLPGKKRMTLQEVREREMMKEAAMQKDPNFGMPSWSHPPVCIRGHTDATRIFVFCNRPFVFLKLWYFFQVLQVWCYWREIIFTKNQRQLWWMAMRLFGRESLKSSTPEWRENISKVWCWKFGENISSTWPGQATKIQKSLLFVCGCQVREHTFLKGFHIKEHYCFWRSCRAW